MAEGILPIFLCSSRRRAVFFRKKIPPGFNRGGGGGGLRSPRDNLTFLCPFQPNLGGESFNDWGGGGRECNKSVPVLGGDDTKIALTRDIFYQTPGEMSSVRGKLADHVGDHVVLSREEVVLMTFPETKLSYPRPPQSLKHSGGRELKGGGGGFSEDITVCSVGAPVQAKVLHG